MKDDDTTRAQLIYLRVLSKFLQIFFRLLYNQFAWVYDFVAWVVSLGRWKRWIRILPQYVDVDQDRILELGHGTGHLQRALSKIHKNVVGIDLSKQMGKIASVQLSKNGFDKQLARGQTQYLPFASHSFVSVLATFPTEYIYAPRTLTEVSRVLTDQGTLIILPVAFITGNSIFDRAAAWLFRITGQAPNVKIPEFEKDLRQRFSRSGFAVDVKSHQLKSSTAIIILAKKINASGPYRNP